jgi:cytochrome c oxidase assembly protein subunit 11
VNAKLNRTTALRLGAVAVGMFGFGFALVPLYDVLCDALDISQQNVRRQSSYTPAAAGPDTSRTVAVQFLANNDATMPWAFHPQRFELKVNPGAVNATTYFVQNPTARAMVAQAIPSVSPAKAAQYFHKIECFCFTQQALGPGAQLDMPLQFVVDQALPSEIHTITLSYTLFDVTGKVPAPAQQASTQPIDSAPVAG